MLGCFFKVYLPYEHFLVSVSSDDISLVYLSIWCYLLGLYDINCHTIHLVILLLLPWGWGGGMDNLVFLRYSGDI